MPFTSKSDFDLLPRVDDDGLCTPWSIQQTVGRGMRKGQLHVVGMPTTHVSFPKSRSFSSSALWETMMSGLNKQHNTPAVGLDRLNVGEPEGIVNFCIDSVRSIRSTMKLWELLMLKEQSEICYDKSNRFNEDRLRYEYFEIPSEKDKRFQLVYNRTHVSLKLMFDDVAGFPRTAEIISLVKPMRGVNLGMQYDSGYSYFQGRLYAGNDQKLYSPATSQQRIEVPDISTDQDDLIAYAFQQSLVHEDVSYISTPILSRLIETSLPFQFSEIKIVYDYIIDGFSEFIPMLIQEQYSRIDEYYSSFSDHKLYEQIYSAVREVNDRFEF